jgi:3-hydroxybutyrate dehydrogenase
LATTHGVEVAYDGADMSNADAIEAMLGNTIQRFGRIDILVNNAGIQHVAPIDEFPVAKWDAILAINLTAAFHTIRHALPAMKRQGFGRIVNVASAHAVVASPFKSAYVELVLPPLLGLQPIVVLLRLGACHRFQRFFACARLLGL